jgi:hypothetical protein
MNRKAGGMMTEGQHEAMVCLPLVRSVVVGAAMVAVTLAVSPARAAGEPERSPEAVIVPHEPGVFLPDPAYEDKPYDPEAQKDIYGGKSAFRVPRPLLELGRRQYTAGPLDPGINVVGRKNLLFPALSAYGDWRTAVAFNDNGAVEQGLLATRLNLDVDLKLTSTERVHAFLRPLDQGGQFSRFEFSADDADRDELIVDGNLETLFFEGDVASIATGMTDRFADFDLPVGVGLMPLLFQNGVWMEDAFTGAGFTVPARNSPALDISNMDVTFFAGFDKVTNAGMLDRAGALSDHGVDIFGVAGFFEANRGYWETGYAFIDGRDGILDDQDHHSVTIAHTRRFRNVLSNSVRFVWTLGQDRANNARQTADGFIVLVENSLITSTPTTLVPYGNFWAGFDRPQSAARDAGAGGILKNTGINFETDGLTGFPKLDDTGRNTWGGAVGVSYLFSLDRQVVLEAASVQTIEGDREPGRPALGDQFAIGARFQQPLDEAWIVRADAMHGWLDEADDLFGVRFEIRRKF